MIDINRYMHLLYANLLNLWRNHAKPLALILSISTMGLASALASAYNVASVTQQSIFAEPFLAEADITGVAGKNPYDLRLSLTPTNHIDLPQNQQLVDKLAYTTLVINDDLWRLKISSQIPQYAKDQNFVLNTKLGDDTQSTPFSTRTIADAIIDLPTLQSDLSSEAILVEAPQPEAPKTTTPATLSPPPIIDTPIIISQNEPTPTVAPQPTPKADIVDDIPWQSVNKFEWYIVQPKDSLWSIATKFHYISRPERDYFMDKVYIDNTTVFVSSNPNQLNVGSKLKVVALENNLMDYQSFISSNPQYFTSEGKPIFDKSFIGSSR